MEEIKILELFAGIGACSKAFEKLNIPHKIVDAVEIDKYAIASFNAIHNTNFEPQDITKWDKNIDVDFILHGSPCQDFSLAGLQRGGDEGTGTRSSLMYESLRIIKKLKPKYVVWENVKNLISDKHVHNFEKYLNAMEMLGYNNSYKVMNSKDYGIPQNRERVFTVSVRKDIDKHFVFPLEKPLTLKLKDMLEDDVDEKYYLSDRALNGVLNTTFYQSSLEGRTETKDGCIPTLAARDYKDPKLVVESGIEQVGQLYNNGYNSQAGRVYSEESLCPTLDTGRAGTRTPKLLIKNATTQGYLEATDGDGIDISSRMQFHRGNVQKDMCQTLTTSGGNDRGVVVGDNKVVVTEPGIAIQKMGDRGTNNYSCSDISYTISANPMSDRGQMVVDGKINKVGNLYPSQGQAGNIYDCDGISPCLVGYGSGGGGKEPKIVVEDKVNVVGNYSPSGHNASRIVDTDGIAPTVMENHGTVTAIVEDEFSGAEALRLVRTDYGKKVRKQYESGDIDGKWSEMKQLEPRNDGITNTLSTVQKDNYILVDDKYYVSDKGVKYILDPKRGAWTDVNADISQTLTANGQQNWTGSFISPDIDYIEKDDVLGSNNPTIIHLKNGETITSDDL